MMALVKVLLVRHKYPPDRQPEASERVIWQAELLADEWSAA
jgi:type I restriction enzyme, R subunit